MAVFLVHVVANPHYGFFRDELYFIICGFHPQFGYADQPPVVPLLSAATQVFGHSLVLLRALPALFAGAGAYVTCLLVEEYGGGAFAQGFAALAFLFTPVLSSFGMKITTDEVGLFTWPLMVYFAVRIAKGANPRLWLWFGVAAGVTLESKYSVVFFLVALGVGLLATAQRAMLRSRWFAAGVGLALMIALPNVLWQMHYGFPMLTLLTAGQQGKNVVVGPLVYIIQELLITGLLLAAVWIAGLVWLFRAAQFRFLAIAYVTLILEMIVFHGKHYYPADVYPILLAAGGVSIEALTRGRTIARAALVTTVTVVGMAFVPLVLPVVSEDHYIAYSKSLFAFLHVSSNATATERHREDGPLPGDWADMHGWPELASTVARLYDALPLNERKQAVVVAQNYGEASAVAFFEPHVPVISGHNQYWLWGTRGFSGNVVVDIGGDCGKSLHLFRHVSRGAFFTNRWAIGYENNLPIMVCRGIREPLAAIWPATRNYR